MNFKSHTPENILAALAADPALKAFVLYTPSGQDDDVLLGYSWREVWNGTNWTWNTQRSRTGGTSWERCPKS